MRVLRIVWAGQKPKWSVAAKEAEDTLIPDLITTSSDQFIIFDAKYYTPVFAPGKSPKSNQELNQ